MKDFTPCEHGSHPMGCIQCQLAVQSPATPQEEQAQTLNDVFDVFATWARRKGATDNSSVSLGFWAFNEFHAIIGQPLRDWMLSRRASAPPAVWQDIETCPTGVKVWIGGGGCPDVHVNILVDFGRNGKAFGGLGDAQRPTHWQPYVVPSPPTPGGNR